MKHWIEISFTPEHVADAGVPFDAIPPDPHLTLLYLGEGWLSHNLDDALSDVAANTYAFTLQVGGFGVLLQGSRQTPVLLANHKTLPDLFSRTRSVVHQVCRKDPKLDYGFQPHITLTRPVSLRFPGKLDVTALTLCATWKDDEGKKHTDRKVYPLLPMEGK